MSNGLAVTFPSILNVITALHHLNLNLSKLMKFKFEVNNVESNLIFSLTDVDNNCLINPEILFVVCHIICLGG
jgi:hypothetical protein